MLKCSMCAVTQYAARLQMVLVSCSGQVLMMYLVIFSPPVNHGLTEPQASCLKNSLNFWSHGLNTVWEHGMLDTADTL